MSSSLPLDNSITFQLILTNEMLPDPKVGGATVTVTLYDPDGAEVSGQTWPLTLPLVADSGNIYRETVPPISGLVHGVIYKAVYHAVGVDGIEGVFTERVKARG